ncbi:Cytochrome P450 [Streptomyces sp. TLI_053]|uniref:cytochrome P450 n=1 Tax=Streptomyces sp. TLI_053 TaxID=1855352 RepID=UPI00087D7D8C|nr:cytochrome P450 [Streptomyces sp. TLI_053]SDT77700.1 Cytochrome P450 [Streptomyces sp. TLI_053]
MDGASIIERLMTAEGRFDPYPLYARAHELGAAVPAGPAAVLVVGHSAANQVLRNPAFVVEDTRALTFDNADLLAHPSVLLLGRSVLQLNAPDHGRVRSLVASAFSARRVAALRPAIEATTARLLDELEARGADGSPVDFMDAFAFRLPVEVVCELLGVPAGDRHRFRALASDLTIALELVQDLGELAAADTAAEELESYFAELVAERLARPTGDLISDLARTAAESPDRISGEELLSNLALLLVAGFETTTNLLGNGLGLLFRHPGAADGLRTGGLDPALFTDEVLRYDSPVQLTSRISSAPDLTVAGLPAPTGTVVLVMLGAANHDPARYPGPDRFDPTRTDSQPLSFGGGPHFCLGSQLARLEAEIAVPALLDRFPRLAPAGVPVRRDRLVLRGYESLPVTVR